MNRRLFLFPLLCLIFLYLFLGKVFQSKLNILPFGNKNIILISIDTLRADHLGTYGYYRNTSPYIDQLARESIVFEKAFSASGYTLPSHVSLFTGLYPQTHKVSIFYDQKNMPKHKKMQLNIEYKTLAEYLSSIGYQTLWGASLHNEQLSLQDSEGRGFQTKLHKMTKISKLFKWLDRNPNKKFFAFLHTSYIHDPYYYREEGDRKIRYSTFTDSKYKGSIIETFDETVKHFNKKYKIHTTEPTDDWYFLYYYKFMNFWWSFVNFEDPKDIQRLKDLYDNGILYVDYHIGLLISYLKKKQLYEKTIIILVSDHGEAFGEHGRFRHETLHREILHVPLIMHIPGFKSKKIDSMVSLIDVYPTILHLIGHNLPHQMDGKSLLPLIKGTRHKVHDYIFSSFDLDTSVSDGKWKLIRTHKGNKELYNIIEDPYETKEISDRYPNILKKLDQKIDTFLEDDPK